MGKAKEYLKNKILDLLKKNPQGLNIKDISKALKSTRITVVKYLMGLEGEGKVRVRVTGPTKLFYLSKKVKK